MRETFPVPNYSGKNELSPEEKRVDISNTDAVVQVETLPVNEAANDNLYERVAANPVENIDDIKRQIDDINDTVREGKLNTTLADQMVADLEQKIYAEENIKKLENQQNTLEQIDRLKSEITHINVLVRDGKMNTTIADQLVAALEKQLYKEEKTITPTVTVKKSLVR
ncbi:hypothetical protein GW766_03255 [Candidatus Parcubacteria bacterium]|nr:hypothetical protein [Candidatus Parcubacteria bacterium]